MTASGVYSILSKKEDAHDGGICCGVYTLTNVTGNPDDKPKQFFVTGGIDGFIKVWQIVNNKLELYHKLEGNGVAIVSVAVSPDGHTIASAALDSTLTIWELVSGNKVHEVETKPTEVWKLVFSPDGTQVATGGHTGKVVVYNVEKGKEERMLDTRGKFAMSVAWSPNGKYIAAGSVDGKIYIFDVSQGKLVHTVEGHTEAIRGLAFSCNSKLLASASDDGKIKIYDTASGNIQSTLEQKGGWVSSVCFSSDLRIATGAADGTVRIAHLAEMNVLHAFHEHTDVVWGVRFNYDNNQLISVSADRSVNIYECPPAPKIEKKK